MLRRLVLALCVIGLLVASGALASTKSHASADAKRNPLCAPVPDSIPNGLTAVWIQVDIRAANDDPIREMGLAIRRYVGPNSYKIVVGVFPGCTAVKFYKSSNIPRRLCVYVPRGYTVTGGSCQSVRDSFNGAKQVAFFVVRAT